MPIRLKHLLLGVVGAAILGLTGTTPAHAVLDGSNRDRLEFLDFSEKMIKDGLYADSGHAVFNRNQRKFIRGIKVNNAPQIYEPDVYTWELAMARHRKKLAQLAPPVEPPIPMVSPLPMSGPGMLPDSPIPLHLTPIGPQAVSEAPAMLPADAQQRMTNMVYRARARGLHPGSELRANEIKQKLLNHIDQLGGSNASSIPALLPALPDLPKGRRGDSCDAEF